MMSSQDMVHYFNNPLGPSLLAYLDGGAGSVLLQVAMSGLLAAAFVYRSAWAGIKNAFKRARRSG